MQVPLEITYRDVPRSDDVDARIAEGVEKLEEVCDHIISCRVAIEKPNEHQQSGSPYRVRIDLTIPPGHEVVVVRKEGEGSIRDDVHTQLQSAFTAARRQVRKLVERQLEEVKSHPRQEVGGVVVKIYPEGYGFIQTPEGREIYFHRNSVLEMDFEDLKVGMGVTYAESMGDDGAQASSIRVKDRRGQPERRVRESPPL